MMSFQRSAANVLAANWCTLKRYFAVAEASLPARLLSKLLCNAMLFFRVPLLVPLDKSIVSIICYHCLRVVKHKQCQNG